jgi:3-deoxy-7-phosphoheptulonate synthase
MGLMLESHLVGGRQSLAGNQPLRYGQSITDACLGWGDTEQLLREVADLVARR